MVWRMLGSSRAEQRREHAAGRLGRQKQIVLDGVVLEHGRLLGTCGRRRGWRFRLRRAWSDRTCRRTSRRPVGSRLAGDDVHHGRLAGPVRADDGARLAGREHERKAAQRLIAVERHVDAVEIEQRRGEAEITVLRSWVPRPSFRRPKPAFRRAAARAWPKHKPKQALGQEERDEDEQKAEPVQPVFPEKRR